MATKSSYKYIDAFEKILSENSINIKNIYIIKKGIVDYYVNFNNINDRGIKLIQF